MQICTNPIPVVDSPGLSGRTLVPMVQAAGEIRKMQAGETIPECYLPSSEVPAGAVPVYNLAGTLMGYLYPPGP